MRYFFNVIDEPVADEDGVEFDDLDAVKLHAFQHAREILADHHVGNVLCERLSMFVTDKSGCLVYSLNISASTPDAR